MGKDNRRIPAPENCLSPTTFKEQKDNVKIINDKGRRNDGRALDCLKSIALQVGIVPYVSGSAYLESGKTKIICSVNGPRDVLNKSESSTKGQIFCEFKFSSFACKERKSYLPTDEEYNLSKSVQEALEPVILLHKFPKSRLDISILVLEDDGGAVSAAITCAGAALSNAGVEMYDLPIGCSLVYSGSHIFVDPAAEEESFCKEDVKISLAMMVEYKSQVILMQSSGSASQKLLKDSFKVLHSACKEILPNIRECLKQHIEDMRESQKDTEEETDQMCKKMEAQLKLFQPQKYISTHLEHNIRPGGRLLDEFRPVIISTSSISTANSSALVRIGNTVVLCGIKAELTNPLEKEPKRGFFVPNVTLTPICSNQYVSGPPTEQAQVYSQMIMDLWKNSLFVDPVDLCIAEGQLSWCIFAEMVCLSCDGSVFDACVLSLIAALSNTKLPETVINTETSTVQVKDTFVNLKVAHYVFSATFAVVGKNVLADPSFEEESLADNSITIFIKDNGESMVHSVAPIDAKQVFKCIASAKERLSELTESLAAVN